MYAADSDLSLNSLREDEVGSYGRDRSRPVLTSLRNVSPAGSELGWSRKCSQIPGWTGWNTASRRPAVALRRVPSTPDARI